ncbi:MAG: DUF2723 domain-containing protein [Ignavibacteria bacterium]|nr:DUF2723 domain-containing protein [Ignavibacteria bacterium]
MIRIKNLTRFFYNYYAVISAVFVLIFYILTLAPGVIASDSGELAAVQYTLGIAHPTGYPLFTILGYIFSHIPIPIRPITKLNLLTAIWSALTVYVLIITIKRILDNYKTWLSKDEQISKNFYDRFELSEELKVIASVFGGLVLGFSKTFWFSSLSVEVYSLHIFLFSLTFYFLTKAFENRELIQQNKFLKDPYFLSFIFLALGFTNHLSTIFIIPAFLFLYFYDFNFSRERIKRFLIYSGIAFVILTLVYLYIPIRAMMQPYLNWGNPVTFRDFINHISGKLYHQFLFPSISEYFSNIGRFLNSLSISFDKSEFQGSDFSIVIVISFLGMIISAFFFKRLFITLMLILCTTMLISAVYNIPDIDAYYLAGHFAVAFFSALGFFYLASIKLSKRNRVIALTLIFVISIFLEINQNYSRVDLSENTLMDDYTLSLLNSVEKNSIVLSSRSSFYFPSLYFQLVEKKRTDVVVAEHKLLQQKWYYTQLNRIHPGIIILKDTVAQLNMENRAVYFSPEMLELTLKGEVKLFEEFELVPVQFLFKLVKKGTYVEAKVPEVNFKFVNPHLFETRDIKNIITNMLLNRAVYELINGKTEETKKYLKELKKNFPDYELPKDLQKLLNE